MWLTENDEDPDLLKTVAQKVREFIVEYQSSEKDQ